MNATRVPLNSIIKKVIGGLRRSLGRVPSSQKKSARASHVSPDVTFYVQRLNKDLYEVSSKAIIGLKGRGTTPDQAFVDLAGQMGEKMSSLIQTTLLMTLHQEEIRRKYKKLVYSFYDKRDRKKRSLWGQIAGRLFGSREKPHLLEVNIALKKDEYYGSPSLSAFHRMDRQILLKTQQGEIPINMLLDQEGNSLDAPFSFGFFVNLN